MEQGDQLTLALVALIVNCIIAFANLFLWVVTRTSVNYLAAQVKKQAEAEDSLSHRAMISNHRELYSELITNPILSKHFFKIKNVTNAAQRDKFITSIIATFLINHASSTFKDHNSMIISDGLTDNFIKDVREMFKKS